jgi:mannosyltransferase OCH1-like enzyme
MPEKSGLRRPGPLRRKIAPIKVSIRRILAAIFLNEMPTRKIDNLYYKVSAGNCLIPNSVYQTWETNRLGRTHLKQLEAFRELNPDYSFEFFDNEGMNSYMKEYYASHPIYEVFAKARFGPLKTDIWRYCILYQRGGLYFDINKSIDLPLREMIRKNDKALISFEQNAVKASVDWEAPFEIRHLLQHPELIIINWGLAFTAGHSFLLKTIQNILADYPKWKMNVVPNVKDAITRFTGPLMFTKSIWESLRQMPDAEFTQAGIDFHGRGNPSMRRSWSRYLSLLSYDEYSNSIIVT